MMPTLVVRPGARNGGPARADALGAPARGTLGGEAFEVQVADTGDLILTPRSPDGTLTPDQQALIDKQHAAFNFMAAERAELLREGEMLRDMATEQRKLDDEYLKKLIALI